MVKMDKNKDGNRSGQLLFLFFYIRAYIEQVIWEAEIAMKSQVSQKQFVFFLAGFLLGVLYIYFAGDKSGDGVDFFSVQNLMQFRYVDIVCEDYFWYLFRKRAGVLLLLMILSLALAGKYLLAGFLMLFGCSMGTLLSVLIIRYGLKGMLLFFGLIFPQDFIYLPAVFGWVALLIDWNEGLFGGKMTTRRRADGKKGKFKRVFLLCGVTIIGIAMECYVNPVVVKWCLKFF